MLAALQVTPRLHVTPLLAFDHHAFERFYLEGLWWSLFNERSTNLVSDHSLLQSLRATLTDTCTDGQCSHEFPSIGFSFGRLHGAALSPQTGQFRPGITMLADFQNENAARGYGVGREWYFTEAQPDEQVFTDIKLMERLRELHRESVAFHDEESTWYYAIGCILGELSGPLFPATSQENTQWEAERQKWLAEYDHR